MLHAISWSVFLMSVISLALAYWIFVGLFYYSRELKQMVSRSSTGNTGSGSGSKSDLFLGADDQAPANRIVKSSSESYDGSAGEGRDTTLFPLAYRLVDELKETIDDAAEKKGAKEELFFAVQIVLAKDSYKGLKNTPFKVAINNLIESECASKIGFTLTQADLNFLWKDR